jgi:hypothetical protein
MSDLVPNPRRQALQRVLSAMQADAAALSAALTRPDELMASRTVWVGGTSGQFEQDMAGRRKALPGIVSRVEQAIRDEIRAMPEMVTRDEAAGRWKAPPLIWQ